MKDDKTIPVEASWNDKSNPIQDVKDAGLHDLLPEHEKREKYLIKRIEELEKKANLQMEEYIVLLEQCVIFIAEYELMEEQNQTDSFKAEYLDMFYKEIQDFLNRCDSNPVNYAVACREAPDLKFNAFYNTCKQLLSKLRTKLI